MTNTTLLTDGARPAVRLERDLKDPPEVVWRAVTEREQLRSWFPCDVIVEGGEWVPGAAIETAGAALAVTLVIGLAGTFGALGRKPAEVLRNL